MTLGSLVLEGNAARADHVEWSSATSTVSLGASIGTGFFAVPNANFGAGSYDIRDLRDFAQGTRSDSGTPVKSPAWFEGYFKPELRLSVTRGGTTVFAGFSGVAATTLGDGDALLGSTTRGDPGSVGLEEAYIGLRLPPPFGLKGDSLEIILGKQNFVIDDGLLVHLPVYNIGRVSGFYVYPRTAFEGFGTVRVNTDPIRADLFVLGAPVNNSRAYGNTTFAVDQPKTQFAGFDIEWFEKTPGENANGAVDYNGRAKYLNFTYFNIFYADEDPLLYADVSQYWSRRKGLNVFSVGAGGNLIPATAFDLDKNGLFHAQYIRQLNKTEGRKVDATGYYLEPGYVFSGAKWRPEVYYRYAHFSGQPGPPGDQTATKRSFDFLFVGGGLRDFFGSYGFGEIMGNYTDGNTNLNFHQVSLKVTAPFHLINDTDTLQFQLLAYKFTYDKPEAVGAQSNRFATEIDFAVSYFYDEKTFAAFAVGAAFPGTGGREAFSAAVAGLSNARQIHGATGLVEFMIFRSF